MTLVKLSHSVSKGRKFKKPGLSLFKDSKIVPKNPSGLFGDTSKSKFMNS
jgi:hypothetical protein